MSVLAADFGGSHIGCALVANGKVLAERTLPVGGETLAGVLPALGAALRACLDEVGQAAAPVHGVAVGFCGLQRAGENRTSAVFGKYADAIDVDWDHWAEIEFGLPLRLRNDAQLALLGEVWAGAAKGMDDVVMVTLGTGIGGAAMLGGRLLESRSGHAGCLGGHLAVRVNGRPCTCGALGCAEAEASTVALPALCREHPGFAGSALAREPVLHFEALFRCADTGDAVACEVVRHCVDVWSALAVSLVHAYGPELVLFGGGVMRRADRVLPAVRAYVAAHACRTSTGAPRVVAAQLGRHAVLLGGEALFAGKAAARGEADHG